MRVDDVVKVEIWDVVDKGRRTKRSDAPTLPTSLKMTNTEKVCFLVAQVRFSISPPLFSLGLCFIAFLFLKLFPFQIRFLKDFSSYLVLYFSSLIFSISIENLIAHSLNSLFNLDILQGTIFIQEEL